MTTTFDSATIGSLPDMTGYLLHDARSLLPEAEYQIRLRETVPPPMHKAKAKQVPMAFGEWRVLRQRVLARKSRAGENGCGENEAAPVLVELVVAREQLAVAAATATQNR